MALPKLNHLKVIILSLLLTWAFFTLNTKPALAHYPHDDIFAVEISPNYQQDRTLFINVRGNLFKSLDGGDSWQPIVNGLDHRSELSTLAISTQSPQILYLTTLGDGVYKSDNGGDSWRKVNRGLNNLNLNQVAIAPDSSDIVLAAGTEKGLYRTENGGMSWSQVMEGQITAIAFDEDKTVVGDEEGKLYASEDRGQSWQEIATLNSGAVTAIAATPDAGLWIGTERGLWQTVDGEMTFQPTERGIGKVTITSLAVSPNYQRDRTIFASAWHEEVFRSRDGGQSWQQYDKGLTKDGQADLSNFNRPHFSDITISPAYSRDRTVFLAGFDGLFKSTDRGRVWREVSTLSPNIIVGFDLSPDYHRDSTIAITTYLRGAYLSQDGGATWNPINRGLAKDPWWKRTVKQLLHEGYVARLFDITFSPNYSQDGTIFSPAWTYFLKSSDRGRQWQKFPLSKELGLNRATKYSVAISPNYAADRTIYLGSMRGTGEDYVLKSTDGGQNFSVVGDVKGQAITYLAISPNFAADRTLYAGVQDGVYRTVDGGQTWQPSQGIPAMQQGSSLAISPNYTTDRTVYAGTNAGLYLTQDAGTSWQKLAADTVGEGYVEAVAVSPNFEGDRTVIVSVRGKGLFKTNDGGTTFTAVGNLLERNYALANTYGFWPPTVALKFSPAFESDRTIYGVANTKLFGSTDGGETWTERVIPIAANASLMQSSSYVYHRLTASAIAKFLVAATVALLSYLVLGRWKFARLPLRKILIKASGAFAAFTLTLMLFSVL